MNARQTIVFIDLAGSTRAYEEVGNAPVAEIITKTTQWIDRVVHSYDGRTLKFLGDGVLAQFSHSQQAVEAAVFMQRTHGERLLKWPARLRMGLKIGIASGDVIELANDAFGDAVNLASRLSDMAGENAIWTSESVIGELRQNRPRQAVGKPAQSGAVGSGTFDAVRYRSLGMVRVRGLAHSHSVFQIEWGEDISSDLMTVSGALFSDPESITGESSNSINIVLSWLGNSVVFQATDMPLTMGRIPGSAFVVSDQRVSRQHTRFECIDGAIVLTDLSSFGTWVRFADDVGTEVPLRRSQMILHGTGEIALGAPFIDFSAPVVAFRVHQGAGPRAVQSRA